MLTWLLLNQIYLEVSHLMIFHIKDVPLTTEQTSLIKQYKQSFCSLNGSNILELRSGPDLCWATLTSHLKAELGDAITLFLSRAMFMWIMGASSRSPTSDFMKYARIDVHLL